MRRISLLLALAAILLSAFVAYTYRLRMARTRGHLAVAPQIDTQHEAMAQTWAYQKDDPLTNKPVVRVRAKSFQATHDPSTFELHELALRLYNKTATSYTYVKSDRAFFDERSKVMKSDGPVSIMMNVPADRDAEDKHEIDKRVRVQTSGVTYETDSGKARTDQAASFVFPQGDGRGVGLDYDPNTRVLHLKSHVSLDWIGNGPADRKMHVEAGDLVYKETEQKIYLSPWSKLQRQTTTVEAKNSVVTLQDGRLHQIDADRPTGTDIRDDRQVGYSADNMTGLFDDYGNLVNILGRNHAKVISTETGSRTTIVGDRADLRFTVDTKQDGGQPHDESVLHLVLADGHAVAESVPLPQPGVQLAETRILRSEHIELEMKPGGQEVQEIRAPSQAQLEFKPNRPDQSHRIVNASHLRVLYGPSSYVDTFLAWNVTTRTEKPIEKAKNTSGADKPADPPAPAFTWSDQLTAKFSPNSNQVSTIEQTGNFRYEEGTRKASAKKAFLEQTINRITLTDGARVLDDTGAAIADVIVMDQANGDMDATGHVVSTHEPDRNQKPGTSMLDKTQPMQAKADQMQTRENNTRVHYEGNAVMWQGANRTSADVIDIDRDAQSLHAVGDVVSDLVDNKSTGNSQTSDAAGAANIAGPANQPQANAAAGSAPVFTVVHAPELFYRDDTRIALYSGGVKLLRDKMVVTSKELKAFLTPKDDKNSDSSSLDHAIANGNVSIFEEVAPGRTRTGTAEHCEYYTNEDKVILNGGSPQMVDSYKGITKGSELTYYNGEDRLVVQGLKKQLAYTQMKKK